MTLVAAFAIAISKAFDLHSRFILDRRIATEAANDSGALMAYRLRDLAGGRGSAKRRQIA